MWWNLLKPKMFRTLRSFGREQEEAETFERNQKQMIAYFSEFGLTKLLNRLMLLLRGANGIMPQVLQYGFGAKLVMSGDLSAGDLTSAINEGTGVFASMQSVYSTWKEVIELLPQCETMVDLLERTPRIGLLPPHAAPMPVAGSAEDLACGGEIEFCDVKFAYPTAKKTKIFNGLSFTIQRGQCIGLMGEAGCGKSTIYNLLLRFYDPSSGHIQLDGKPLVSYNPMWLRRQCGHVGQEPVLFGKTLREEVLYG
jgi:ABC-type multidrug transport system fused ATPase/permease subunit